MQSLTSLELKTTNAGFPWLLAGGIALILGAGFVHGCNEARYETTADSDSCEDECAEVCQ